MLIRMPLLNACCLALHSDQLEVIRNLEGIYNYFLKLCADLGATPTYMGITAKGFSDKMMPWDEWERRFQHCGLPRDATGFVLDSGYLGSFTVLGASRLTAIVNNRHTPINFCFDSYLRGLDQAFFRRISQELYGYCPYNYGYAHIWPFRKGPKWFSYGILNQQDYTENGERIARWRRHVLRCSHDHTARFGNTLRDVFPMNFLTEEHLMLRLANELLKDWIAADSGRGLLSRLNEQIWVWDVPVGNISMVRNVLIQNGMLVAYIDNGNRRQTK